MSMRDEQIRFGRELIEDYFDGTLETVKLTQLDRLLCEVPEVSDAYVQAARLDGALAEVLVRRNKIETAKDTLRGVKLWLDGTWAEENVDNDQLLPNADIRPTAPDATRRWQPPGRLARLSRYLRRPAPLSILIALLLTPLLFLIPAGLISLEGLLPPAAPEAPGIVRSGEAIARLTGAVDCQWADSRNAHPVGWQFRAGETVELRQGLVQVQFQLGTRVTLEGPCRFRIVKPSLGRMEAGRMVALVPPADHGFTLETPQATVVDLGTEFGVEVSSDEKTEVQVFCGMVEVAVGSQRHVLMAGHGLRVGKDRVETIDAKDDRLAAGSKFPRVDLGHGYRIEGAVRTWPARLPPLINSRRPKNAGLIWMFPERRGVMLDSPIRAELLSPGSITEDNLLKPGVLEPGQKVDSFLLYSAPRKDSPDVEFSGTVTFDRPVVAVICGTKTLANSHRIFKLPRVKYEGDGHIELLERDQIILDEDRRTLHVRLRVDTFMDFVRVLIASE